MPDARRDGNGAALKVKGARENNLKSVNVNNSPWAGWSASPAFSGSGKSTLVYEILYKRLAQTISRAKDRPGKHDAIEGMDYLDKVINHRPVPPLATLPAAIRPPTRAPSPPSATFSPAFPNPRCEATSPAASPSTSREGAARPARGEGYTHVEMQFLPDVTVPCEVCKGRRYNREALEIHYKEKSIAEVLGMTVYHRPGVLPEHSGKFATSWRPCGTWAWATSGWASPPPPYPAAKPSG